jgi:hypothetical protein
VSGVGCRVSGPTAPAAANVAKWPYGGILAIGRLPVHQAPVLRSLPCEGDLAACQPFRNRSEADSHLPSGVWHLTSSTSPIHFQAWAPNGYLHMEFNEESAAK